MITALRNRDGQIERFVPAASLSEGNVAVPHHRYSSHSVAGEPPCDPPWRPGDLRSAALSIEQLEEGGEI